MNEGFHRFVVSDPAFPPIRLMVALPKNQDAWGVLAPLRTTMWGALVPEVSGEAVAHARHGYASPLLKEIGPSPSDLVKRIPRKAAMCALSTPGTCAGATDKCRPGPKLPDCYEPPGLSGAAQNVAAELAIAWRDGWYVIVVVGAEFNLL